jgi:hypothetical protein
LRDEPPLEIWPLPPRDESAIRCTVSQTKP